MLNNEILHALRAAHQIWVDAKYAHDEALVVVGSQSLLLHNLGKGLPAELTKSIEIDVFLVDHPDKDTSDIVNSVIGEGSMFHETYGYYADGVSLETISLPDGWIDRCKKLTLPASVSQMNEEFNVLALAPQDLIASKLKANRSKDRRYVLACKEARLVEEGQVRQSVEKLPGIVPGEVERLMSVYRSLGNEETLHEALGKLGPRENERVKERGASVPFKSTAPEPPSFDDDKESHRRNDPGKENPPDKGKSR